MIVYFEILTGSNSWQNEIWHKVFENIEILPLNEDIIFIAIKLQRDLKKKRKTSDAMDLLIAATARFYDYNLATLNQKHFIQFQDLIIIEI